MNIPNFQYTLYNVMEWNRVKVTKLPPFSKQGNKVCNDLQIYINVLATVDHPVTYKLLLTCLKTACNIHEIPFPLIINSCET